MTQTTNEVKASDYTTVDGTKQLDLQFYRDIGLNLRDLEDPSPEAEMPRLRRAAKLVVETVRQAPQLHSRAVTLLQRNHEVVEKLIVVAQGELSYEGLDDDHPAVQAWQRRELRMTNPKSTNFTNHLPYIKLVYLGLVRPITEQFDPESDVMSRYLFRPVSLGNTNYYNSAYPEEVADQLTQARAGFWSEF